MEKKRASRSLSHEGTGGVEAREVGAGDHVLERRLCRQRAGIRNTWVCLRACAP